MIEGWNKADPPTQKKLPVEVDIPELLLEEAAKPNVSEKEKAVADWTLIAFYYLLRIGEYSVKKSRNYSKQTRQFKMKDVVFFTKSECGQIFKLMRDATDEQILAATSASLKLDNQKNGWKAFVCTIMQTEIVTIALCGLWQGVTSIFAGMEDIGKIAWVLGYLLFMTTGSGIISAMRTCLLA